MDFRWTVAIAARHYRPVSFVLALLACWLGGTPSLAATIERVEIRHDQIQLELPLGDVRDLEIHVVDDGVAVWLTHGNEHGVLDKDGNLIERI